MGQKSKIGSEIKKFIIGKSAGAILICAQHSLATPE